MELILLIGLQATGKTTFYRQRLADGYMHIRMDLLRNNPHPARRQAQLLDEALQAGQSIVLDNTSPTVEVRPPDHAGQAVWIHDYWLLLHTGCRSIAEAQRRTRGQGESSAGGHLRDTKEAPAARIRRGLRSTL
jgi:hypothetical protein